MILRSSVESYVPVKSAILPTFPPNFTSFGIKSLFVLSAIAGWRSSSKSTHAVSPSTNCGRQAGSPRALEDLARLKRQSSSAMTRIARSQMLRSLSNSANKRNLKSLMLALRLSRASLSCRIVPTRAGTVQREKAYKMSGLMGIMSLLTNLGSTALDPVSRNISVVGANLNQVNVLDDGSAIWTAAHNTTHLVSLCAMPKLQGRSVIPVRWWATRGKHRKQYLPGLSLQLLERFI